MCLLYWPTSISPNKSIKITQKQKKTTAKYRVLVHNTVIICPDFDTSISAEKCADIYLPITRPLSEKPASTIFRGFPKAWLSTALILLFLWQRTRQFVLNRDLFAFCCGFFGHFFSYKVLIFDVTVRLILSMPERYTLFCFVFGCKLLNYFYPSSA